MDYLIQKVEILDKYSPFYHQEVDLRIQDGVIREINPTQDDLSNHAAQRVLSGAHLKASIGWFDLRASFGDPGFEHKETLQTGRDAAQRGGFSEIALLPNTHPVVQNKNTIAYLQKSNAEHLVKLHPIAAVTLNTEGKELTEMIDLHHSGAVAFSDGDEPIWHSDILVKTLLYLQKFDGLLMNRAEDKMLTRLGTMHEGVQSTLLGLRGIPSLAEEMMIQRDLSFLEYAGGKIHFSVISSAKSVELIRQAKQKGLAVTCDVAAHQMAFTDEALQEFDTNFKVNPPFRTQQDIDALWEGLRDGTIDVIVSDHHPQDEESKQIEFDQAAFGMISLESFFPVVWQESKGKISLEELLEKFTYRPREILKQPLPSIREGELAHLTLFSTEQEWTYEPFSQGSKSRNTPFYHQVFRGKALGVFHQNQVYLHEALFN